MFRRSVQITLAALVLAALSVGTAATVQRQRKRATAQRRQAVVAQPRGFTVTGRGTDFLVIRLSDAGHGLIHVEADANLPGGPRPQEKVWWCVEIRDGISARANTQVHEYQHQTFVMQRGQGATPTFADDFAVEAGRYNVLVGVKTDRRYARPDGTIEPFDYSHARSAWVDVK
jgi:hypothetical protein